MDTIQWEQEIGVVKPMEEKRRARPEKEHVNCPRCNSTNTKFCYYNNYSLTQPRYFCKTCRRYWTEGGSLRNVPVGGGSRKNKRSSTSSISSRKLSGLNIPSCSQISSQNPKIQEGLQDLNLVCQATHDNYNSISEFVELSNNPSSSSPLSVLELLRTGTTSRGLNSFMPMPLLEANNTVYSSGFPLRDFKPTLDFSLDGLGSGCGNMQGVQETNGRILFPFQDPRQNSSTTGFHEQITNKGQGNSTGYWSGMLGGGSW